MELTLHSFFKLCKILYSHWVKDAEPSWGPGTSTTSLIGCAGSLHKESSSSTHTQHNPVVCEQLHLPAWADFMRMRCQNFNGLGILQEIAKCSTLTFLVFPVGLNGKSYLGCFLKTKKGLQITLLPLTVWLHLQFKFLFRVLDSIKCQTCYGIQNTGHPFWLQILCYFLYTIWNSSRWRQ